MAKYAPDWFPVAAFYFALFNGVLVSAAGAVLGWKNATTKNSDDLEPLRLQVVQTLGTVVGANVTAAVILGGLRWALN